MPYKPYLRDISPRIAISLKKTVPCPKGYILKAIKGIKGNGTVRADIPHIALTFDYHKFQVIVFQSNFPPIGNHHTCIGTGAEALPYTVQPSVVAPPAAPGSSQSLTWDRCSDMGIPYICDIGVKI